MLPRISSEAFRSAGLLFLLLFVSPRYILQQMREEFPTIMANVHYRVLKKKWSNLLQQYKVRRDRCLLLPGAINRDSHRFICASLCESSVCAAPLERENKHTPPREDKRQVERGGWESKSRRYRANALRIPALGVFLRDIYTSAGLVRAFFFFWRMLFVQREVVQNNRRLASVSWKKAYARHFFFIFLIAK